MSAVDNEVDQLLYGIAENLTDQKRVLKAGIMGADYIRKHIQDADFEPLSSVTVEYRGKGDPLKDTLSLRDSITFELVNGATVSVGTNKLYAPIQNNGGVITARKQWLFIPAGGTRQLERRYGRKPGDVLSGLRNEGYWVYRVGRTVCYRKKSKKAKPHVAYYLKKSVEIPKREFFYLTDNELETILSEVTGDIL